MLEKVETVITTLDKLGKNHRTLSQNFANHQENYNQINKAAGNRRTTRKATVKQTKGSWRPQWCSQKRQAKAQRKP